MLAAVGRAIAFGFSDLSVAVIPAEAGIQGRVTGFGALDSRFRGNDSGEKGNSLAKCDCPAAVGTQVGGIGAIGACVAVELICLLPSRHAPTQESPDSLEVGCKRPATTLGNT